MARIRTIKPEFWQHEDLSALPSETHMLAAALLNYADDEGYFNANPKLVQAACCPLRELSVTVHESLNELARIGYLRFGKGDDGKTYGHIITFLDHQVINRPKPSKIKAVGVSWSNHGLVSDASPPEGKGMEGKGTGTVGAKAPLASVENKFLEFYSAFPKKVAKGAARKSYKSALSRASPDDILAGAKRYAALRAGQDAKYTAAPAKWLNDDRWLDEIATKANGTGSHPTWSAVQYEYKQKYGDDAFKRYTEDRERTANQG